MICQKTTQHGGNAFIYDGAESKREHELLKNMMARTNLDVTDINCYSDKGGAKVYCTHYYQIQISSFSSVCI